MTDLLFKRAFFADGVTAAVSAALLIGTAELLAEPTGLSAGLLTGFGWFFAPFALLHSYVAISGSQPAARFGIGANIAWSVVSLLAIPLLQPTLLGTAAIAAQAAAVAGIAWIEWHGLRRLRGLTA